MPSPVGHSIIGLAIGSAWLLPRAPLGELVRRAAREWRALAAAVLLANLPDADYLPGLLTGDLNRYHHLYTHTLGFAVLATLGAGWLWTRLGARPRWLWCSIFLLVTSHLVADLFSADLREPIGIMILWPFSPAFYLAPKTVFWPLYKATVAEMFQWHNVGAVLVEVAWCLPLLLAVAWWKARRADREGAPAFPAGT